MRYRAETAVGTIRAFLKAPNLIKEAFRFLIVGGVNTLVGYGSYLLLLTFFSYTIAYGISYALGIAVSYVLSARFVFGQPMRLRSALRFPLVYGAQFLLGVVLLRAFVELAHVPTWVAPLLVTLLTIPVTFFLSRVIVRAR